MMQICLIFPVFAIATRYPTIYQRTGSSIHLVDMTPRAHLELPFRMRTDALRVSSCRRFYT